MSDTPQPNHNRRNGLAILGLLVVIGAGLYGLYWFMTARFYATTDDAYVGGDVVAITSREPATVLALHADNTQSVVRGQLLVELDPIHADVGMESAEANLAKTVRDVRAKFARVGELKAQQAAVQVTLAQAQADYKRRTDAGNTVSQEELIHARDAVTSAQAAVSVLEAGLDQAEAAVEGTKVSDNPEVLAAVAQLRAAAIVLDDMKLAAPVTGIVAQRTVQIGQQVTPGTPLMAVVPIERLWVDANFKEGQLMAMRVGQPVTVTADVYGGDVVYHGKIQGFGAGSGSAFALLPPQNASGNWIKIVQRVPVRVALDAAELRAHPLRVGLSVAVSIDLHEASGPSLDLSPQPHEIRAAAEDSTDVDHIITRILADNGA